MSAIEEILRARITSSGPVTVAEFMDTCMSHPEHGYYMTRDPFGEDGDFITAPEISQIFGELIGVWCISVWRTMKRPEKINIIEMGPGRGTLMADAMRAGFMEKEFHDAVRVHLVETSPALREIQERHLGKYNPVWYKKLEDVPEGLFIVIGNEFLDALPIRQFIKKGGKWHERQVGLVNSKFDFLLEPLPENMVENLIPRALLNSADESVYEYRPAAIEIVRHLNERMRNYQGAALFIDYGHQSIGSGDTLQAVYRHHPSPVFDNLGAADLTAHVDFETLIKSSGDMITPYLTTQGRFLNKLGIEMRTEILAKANPGDKAKDIRAAADRLTSASEMGQLFKVLALVHQGLPAPTGFRT